MIKLIMSRLNIEIADLDYQIILNNYLCNQGIEPEPGYIKTHETLRVEIDKVKEIKQLIMSLEENL